MTFVIFGSVNSMNKNLKGSLILLLCAMIWGLAFSAQDMAAAHLPVFTIGAVRSAIATVFLAITVAVIDKSTGSERFLFSRKKNSLSVG